MSQTKAELIKGLNINASAPATALQIDASGNVNIDSNTLYVDATNNRVGLGTSSPGNALDVRTAGTAARFVATNGNNNQIAFSNAADGAFHFFMGSPAIDVLQFSNSAGTERARIDSSGRLLVGTSTARDKFNNASGETPNVQIEGTGTTASGLYMLSMTANNTSSSAAAGPAMFFGRSEGTTTGSYTVVSADKNLGRISFQGADGTEFVEAAKIDCFVDGTPGANDMPGRLVFSTTADGASSPTERMRIVNSGEIGVSMTPVASNRLCVRAATDGASILADSAQAQGTGWYLFYGTSGSVAVVQAWIRGDGTYGSRPNVYGGTSDIKLKENIEPASSQWSDLKSIELVNYNFIGDDVRQLGVIAQQVETISPGLVDETKDKDSDGNETGTVTKSVKYSVLYLKAVKALQEAMERIEQLESSNADLLARVTALEAS